MSIKGCWWGPPGHYTWQAHSVNPCAFAGGFLHHLVLFSSPRCSQSSERGLGWPGSLALIGMWHRANLWGDYLPGFGTTLIHWMMLKFKHIGAWKSMEQKRWQKASCFVCKIDIFLFAGWTISSFLSSHNSTELTHIKFRVGTLGRRKLGANQAAPGRKGSFYGCVIVSHTHWLTLELFTIDDIWWTFYR